MNYTLEIIPFELVTNEMDLRNCPFYKLQDNGNIKFDYGIKKGQDTLTFFDVTEASEEFKKKHSGSIMKLKNIANIVNPYKNDYMPDETPSSKDNEEITFMPFSMVKREMLRTLKDCPIYEIREDGILLVKSGYKIKRNTMLAYDISNTSESFKSQNVVVVKEHVNRLTHVGPVYDLSEIQKTDKPNNTSLILLDIDDDYIGLSNEEKKAIGFEFITLENTGKGLRINPMLSVKNSIGKAYLLVNPTSLTQELYEKLSSSLHNIHLNEQGYYEVLENEVKEKSL